MNSGEARSQDIPARLLERLADGLVCLLTHAGEVPVQVVSRQVLRLGRGAELRRDDRSELPPEGRRWSFVDSPLDVAAVVPPDGPSGFAVQRCVAPLIARSDGLPGPDDQVAGVVGDRRRRWVPNLDGDSLEHDDSGRTPYFLQTCPTVPRKDPLWGRPGSRGWRPSLHGTCLCPSVSSPSASGMSVVAVCSEVP